MRDIRDPEEVYRQLMLQKTGWNCSIVEAADRVEAASRARAQTAPSGAWSVPAGQESELEVAPQNGAQASEAEVV